MVGGWNGQREGGFLGIEKRGEERGCVFWGGMEREGEEIVGKKERERESGDFEEERERERERQKRRRRGIAKEVTYLLEISQPVT